MDTGAVGSAKELESLAHELETLARRQGALEEIELEAMERLEGVQARLTELRERERDVVQRLEVVGGSRDELLAGIAKDAEYLGEQRAREAQGLPTDLLALYDKLRADQGGVGAAALHQGRCEGCRLQLTPTDLARIRSAPEDEVIRCDECRRILVRAPSSG